MHRTVSLMAIAVALIPSLASAEQFTTPVGEARILMTEDYFLIFGGEDELTAGLGMADFDGDGDTDMAVINGRHWPGQDVVMFNNGAGRFPAAADAGAMRTTGYGASPADVDGDGDIDLVIARDLLSPAVYLNDGTGDLGQTVEFGEPGSARDIATGDFNGDGIIDAVLTDRGDGSFIAYGPLLDNPQTEVIFEGDAVGVEVADLNADDLDDIIFTIRGGATLAVLLNQGGGFADAIMLGAEDQQSRAVAAADMDSDGDMDLVAAVLTGPNRIFWNEGGSFDRSEAIGPEDEASAAVAIADMDQDGRPDAIFGNEGKNSLYLNREDGFEIITIDGDGGDTYDIKAVDITGDEYPEILIANSGSPNFIYWNRPAPSPEQAED
ncbi:VCBS repeat-containing protein [Parvularcula flava]|uniref:Cysteine proteinase n=1 Tax=Aquisalinus luteolus TaxID=1566827 RepID=A0A8J3A269_9PROT|nr:VCBS repeat-containing protein [Aquisalinus luteolus]NHK26760.1 VCBS repeat-containing protein [Aquisalinus luteolus]GGH93328.1 cysteine proteinase [Aquisalinus luteolus]